MATVFQPGKAATLPQRTLSIERRTIEVKGRAASVYGIVDETGDPGLHLPAGAPFSVRLKNAGDASTIVHWHGQTPPPELDGVEETGYTPPLATGEVRNYEFTPRPGTHWMHSHTGLLEQSLLAAPLVVQSAEDTRLDVQDVTIMLHDFSFRTPEELLAGLVGPGPMAPMDMGTTSTMGGMDMSGPSMATGSSMGAMDMSGADLNDIQYDAFLANDRTLADPEVVRVERGGRVRLRVINGASATGFWIDFGSSGATLIATDGNPVLPFIGSRFPIAQAQRLDFLVGLEPGQVLPVFAQREGDVARTGMILAAVGAVVAQVDEQATVAAPPIDLSVETSLSAVKGLPSRPADVRRAVELTGSMSPYHWTINGKTFAERTPLTVAAGQRVELEIANRTMMAHPMHLHGHHFQLVALSGTPLSGPMRDTLMVPPMASATVAFDADNPGRWLFHCHNLYHMAAGMMTELVYT